MAKTTSISIRDFTASVQNAVKAAVAQHPKFAGVEVPNELTLSYWIWGIPAWESILQNVTVAEVQAFANDVAAQIAPAHPEAFELLAKSTGGQGTVFSRGGHVILGIPPFPHVQVRS